MDIAVEAVRSAHAVIFSWHGVLFDRGRRSIHEAVRGTFARWGVEVSDAELELGRGPTGRAQLVRMLSQPRLAEAFRARHRRWVSEDDLAMMTADLEPRLIEAAERAALPNPDACAALTRLHDAGVRTAVVCCTPRRLLGPQLEALARAGVPLDAVVTADEACEPAPTPWGIFEAVRQLGLADASGVAMIDDSPAGATAARNAGAIGIALDYPGQPSASDAVATLRSLDHLR
jgi:phosphonoacetaldehyde hydrolase